VFMISELTYGRGRGSALEALRDGALYKSTYFTFYFNVT